MAKKPKPQSQKFIDKARELGVDEDEKAFDAKLKSIAKSRSVKPQKKSEPGK